MAKIAEPKPEQKPITRRDLAAIEILGRIVDRQVVENVRQGGDGHWRENIPRLAALAVYGADLLLKELDKEPS